MDEREAHIYEIPQDEEPLDDQAPDFAGLWPQDTGTLPYDARCALLRLVKGPYIGESADPALWRALVNHSDLIRSRLADLFLELIIDAEAGVAFAKNATAEGKDFPKAATAYRMTLLDTIMVLLLRRELQMAGSARVFIGKTDLFAQMEQYRPLETMDQSAFLKRLDASWSRLTKQRLLVKSDVEGRYEVSPVLKLVFGAEEARAVFEEYQQLLESKQEGAKQIEDAPELEGSLFDGLE